jgi:hypothetical protein
MNHKLKLRLPALAALVSIGLFGGQILRAQSESETRHHGYEHGYRDGYSYGRDAHARGAALDIRSDAYRDADHGYRIEFGPKEEYETGYREGYRMGADDGFAGNTSRFEHVFGDEHYTPNDRWGYQDIASEMGYRDGVTAGLKDAKEHHSFRPTEHDQWKDGDRGYHDSLGSKESYKVEYRKAYEAGYRDGYGPPR